MTDGVRVSTSALTVTIGDVRVLDDLTVAFAPGRVTAVIGPSGSGKTTLFNVLAGLQRITSGTVDFDGVPVDRATARVGLVHQAFALLALLTAAENVELAAQVRRRPRDEVLAAAERCLQAVGMTDRAAHLVEELSGGEQQRVAIARSMITEPHLLLADEPTAQLDPDNRETVIDLLRGIAQEGATVLVATHDPEVAVQCDTVVELRSGRIATDARNGRHRQ